MSRNSKIEKINAYKKMLETRRLPSVKTEEKPGPRNPEDINTYPVDEQIHLEFAIWAESQLAELLGEGKPIRTAKVGIFDVFDEDQIRVLQTFADKMLVKAAAAPAPEPERQAPRPTLKENRTGTMTEYKTNPNAQPIGNRLRERQQGSSKTTSKQDAYLKELERQDREAPEID